MTTSTFACKRGRFDDLTLPTEMRQHVERTFGPHDYDPCPLNWKVDGLDKDIRWGKKNYMHPPNSQTVKWITRAVYEVENHGVTVTAFIAAKTNSSYWRKLVLPNAIDIRFVRHRITFAGFKSPMPVAYAVVVFGPAKPSFQIEELKLGATKYTAWRLIQD